MSQEISKTKERVLKRVEDRKRMFSTFIICVATAIVSILLLILIRLNLIPLQTTLGSVSFLLPGLIRIILLVLIYATLMVAVANIREYYVVGVSSWFDVISLLVCTALFAYFMFDFPGGIADTLSTIGGCALVIVYFYLIQD
ncbi:MAG: hypothetical protein ACTSQI_01285 [Candidatus Helarchaeota archaeon]